MLLHQCLDVNSEGHLTIGGADAVGLAARFGTPAYIMDEATVRRNCRAYKNAFAKYFGDGSFPVYASKALSFKQMYRIVAEEGFGADVVSPGELYTAKTAGFPMEKIYFHGNNKTDADIEMAVGYKIGTFVADNREELESLNRTAANHGIRQRILLRLTPGIDPHTHKAMSTGKVDSKFGSSIITGQAAELAKYALSLKNIELRGFHCHIGSQIFESEPFIEAVRIMIKFIADMKTDTGFEAKELNLGGGFGVRYVDEHRGIDVDAGVREISEAVGEACLKYGINKPDIILEPGRSIVAAAGVTLYTVGSVKEITGFKNYVSVDGGMPDNPRYALYQSLYTAVIANRAGEPKTYKCTLAGRCCESGDLLAENIPIQPTKRGDILAVFVTGAYNYSMASNYNRIPRPPVIFIKDGEPYIAVERETYEDLIKNDV